MLNGYTTIYYHYFNVTDPCSSELYHADFVSVFENDEDNLIFIHEPTKQLEIDTKSLIKDYYLRCPNIAGIYIEIDESLTAE